MRRNKFISLVLVLLIVITSGCVGGRESSDENIKDLNFSIPGSPATMDPQMVTDTLSAMLVDIYCGKLYRYNSEGDIVPDLAESYEVSDDGLSWTFHLADGIKWSNGDPITADDFVFSAQRMADPESGSGAVFYITNCCQLKNIEGVYSGELEVSELGVHAIDNQTLCYEFEEPCPYFLSLITCAPFAPCNRNFFYSCNEHFAESAEYLIASGAYVIDRYEPLAVQILYSKNPNYIYRDSVDIDEVTCFSVANNQQGYMCFDTEQLDITTVSGELLDIIGDDSRCHEVPGGAYYLSFNFKSDAIKNLNIRRALIRSVDREAIAKNVVKSGAVPMTRFVQEGFYFPETREEYAEETKYFDSLCSYDTADALRLWNQGLSELGVSKVTLNLAYKPSAKSIVEVLQDQWQKNLPGLEITFTAMTAEQWVVALDGGDYDMIFGGWAPDYADPTAYLNNFMTNVGATSPLFSDPVYDGLLAQSRAQDVAQDPEVRNGYLHQAERYLAEQGSFIPLIFMGSSVMVADRVQNFSTVPTGSTYIIQDMRLEETA